MWQQYLEYDNGCSEQVEARVGACWLSHGYLENSFSFLQASISLIQYLSSWMIW
jgi:hypothetical protein